MSAITASKRVSDYSASAGVKFPCSHPWTASSFPWSLAVLPQTNQMYSSLTSFTPAATAVGRLMTPWETGYHHKDVIGGCFSF